MLQSYNDKITQQKRADDQPSDVHRRPTFDVHRRPPNRWILMDEREIFRKPNIEASCAISFDQLWDKQLPGLTNFKENR